MRNAFKLATVFRHRPPAFISIGAPLFAYDFTTGSLPSGWSIVRASGATDSTYQDGSSASTYNVIANNTPRLNPWGILVEPSRSNIFLNSDAPVTQTITVGTSPYVVWLVGSGSIAVTAGTATGTGFATATNGNPVYLNITGAGTIVCTVTGTVYRAQVELGTAPSSYIVSGASPLSRNDDRLSINLFSGLNVNEGTYWVEWVSAGPPNGARILTCGTNSFTSDANTDQIDYLVGLGIGSGMTFAPSSTYSGQADTVNTFVPGQINRIAMSIDGLKTTIAGNGVQGATYQQSARPSTLLGLTLGSGGTGYALNGYIRRCRYWPLAMSNAELVASTAAGYFNEPVLDLDCTVANNLRFFTFARTTTTGQPTDATLDQAAGTSYATYATGASIVPRINATKGVIIENGRNNFLPNSTAPANANSFNISSQWYGLTMRGSGSVAVTVGTTTGAGQGFPATATQGVPAYFMPGSTGNVAVAVTGSVEWYQVEQLGSTFGNNGPTTLIKSVASGQSRGGETMTMPIGGWWNQLQGTYLVDFIPNYPLSGGMLLTAYSSSNEREQLFVGSAGSTWVMSGNTIGAGGTSNPGRIDSTQVNAASYVLHRVAYAIGSTQRQIAMDGVLGGVSMTVGARPIATLFGISTGAAGGSMGAWVKRVRYYDYPILNAALTALTT